eukprot:scaffold320_cov335-Pavlova_lutheri.AAC.9
MSKERVCLLKRGVSASALVVAMPRARNKWYDSDDLVDEWDDEECEEWEEEGEENDVDAAVVGTSTWNPSQDGFQLPTEGIQEGSASAHSTANRRVDASGIKAGDGSEARAPNVRRTDPKGPGTGSSLAQLLDKRLHLDSQRKGTQDTSPSWKQDSMYPWTPAWSIKNETGEGEEMVDEWNSPEKAFEGPSPDDVVLLARKKGGPAVPTKKAKASKLGGLKSRNIQDKKISKHRAEKEEREAKEAKSSSNLERVARGEALPPTWDAFEAGAELQDARESTCFVHVAMLGHVDAGKSTLAGRLLHATGGADAKAMREAQRAAQEGGDASRSWAFLLDAREGERKRGVTQDVAEARLSIHSTTCEIEAKVSQHPSKDEGMGHSASHPGPVEARALLLDAPGHGDFTPATIRAMARADAAVLVIDGSRGGFEAGMATSGAASAQGGRTREHVVLARSLGVEQLIVAITKMDACGFDSQRFEEVRGQLGHFLRKCGFDVKKVLWVPVSGVRGDNVVEASNDESLLRWYSGPTLLQAIGQFKVPKRQFNAPLRMAVIETEDTVNRELATTLMKGAGRTTGCVVRGKVDAGVYRVGGHLALMPSGATCEVKAAMANGSKVDVVKAGDDALLILDGLKPQMFAEGDVLCDRNFPVPVVTSFEARIRVLDIKMPLLKGQELVLHTKTTHEQVTLSMLVAVVDPKTQDTLRNKPRCLTRNQTALVHVTCPKGICLEKYSDVRSLGRITLRDQGITLAVGIVSDLLVPSTRV